MFAQDAPRLPESVNLMRALCSFAGGPTGYMGPTTPCVEANVSLPEAFPGG